MMEVEDGVLGIVHGLPSSGLAITLLCTTPFNRKVFRSKSSTKARIPVKLKGLSGKRHQNPAARDSVENSRNMKKVKNVDVLTYLSRCKTRVVGSCNPKMCPKLKERLEHHRRRCHLNVSYTKIKPDILITPETPVTSKLQLMQNENSKCCELNEGYNKEEQNRTELLNSILADDTSSVPLRNTVTYDVVSLKNKKTYEANLREEITKWLQNILTYFYQTHSIKIQTEKFIDRLINQLLNINISDPNYEKEVRREIEKTLRSLNILTKTLNGSKKFTYDNGVIDNFMKRLRKVNSRDLGETLVLTKTNAEDKNSQINTNLSKNKDNKSSLDSYAIDIDKNIMSKDEAQNSEKGSIGYECYSENLNTEKEIKDKSSKSVRDALINKLLNTNIDNQRECKNSERDFKIDEEESEQSELKIEELYKKQTNCIKSNAENQPKTESLSNTKKMFKSEIKKNQDHLDVFAANSCCRPPGSSEPCTSLDNNSNNNSTMLKEVITRFIQYKDEVDDPVATNAIGKLLENEMFILNNQSINLIELSTTEKLARQLHYVKIISDWVKDVPMDESFNTTRNIQRIELIVDLSQELSNVEDITPNVSAFEAKAKEVVTESMKKLPILDKNLKHITHTTEKLLKNIAIHKNKCSYCGISDTEHVVVSNETSGLNEQNLADFLEEYIRIHGSDIDDELKLEAWVTRLIQEIKKVSQNTSKLTKGVLYNELSDVPVPDDEEVRIFGLKLGYVKEISDWLHNLSLQSVQSQQDREALGSMVCDLAEKMAARERKIMANPNDIEADSELNSYIINWVEELPLVSNQEMTMSVILTQLKNRMERVNKEVLKANSYAENQKTLNSKELSSIKDKSKTSNMKRLLSSKSKIKSQSCTSPSCQSKPRNPAQSLVEFIEKWTNDLPIKGKDEVKTLKNNIANEIFKKIGELNLDLGYRDNDLYEELLLDNVNNILLQNLQNYPEVQKKKEKLKNDFIKRVMNFKNLIDEKNAGDIYKQDLENTIETLMPIPVISTDPGLQIYKSSLAKMFILQNFDNSDEPIKMKYEKKIKADIDKYIQNFYKTNNVPLTNDQIYNELYSSLFAVPVSNFSLQNKVEEIKTRVEIDTWLDETPIKETNDVYEIFQRDQILDTLAIRLREMELNNDKDEVIHKEIIKILAKLPLKPGKEGKLDDYANRLQSKLKSSTETRKCFTVNNNAEIKSLNKKNKNSTDYVSDVSTVSVNKECCAKFTSEAYKKTVDIIEETIDSWCQDLPLKVNTKEEEINIKRQIITQIITIVSELNANSTALHNDYIYWRELDSELDKILTNLTFCCNRHQCKDIRKQLLINELNFIILAVRNEVIRHEYRQELNKTVENILNNGNIKPQHSFTKKRLIEEIVDYFIEYSYNKEDIESQMLPKVQIQNALMKYQEQVTGLDVVARGPLIKRNQLITELAKVESPNETLIRDETLEVRMKKEVSDFLNAFQYNDRHKERIHEIRNIMAKRLNDIEMVGHNCATREQMKREIAKYLKKLYINIDNNSKAIENFIERLKNTEESRRTHSAKMKNEVDLKLDSQYFCKESRSSSRIKDNSSLIDMPLSKNKEKYNSNPKCKPCQESGSELKMLKLEAEQTKLYVCPGCGSRQSLKEMSDLIGQQQTEHLKRNNSSCGNSTCDSLLKDNRATCIQCGPTKTKIGENSDDDVCNHCMSKKRPTKY